MPNRLLLIDDDSDQVLVLSRALQSLNLSAEISGTSQIQIAFEMFKETKPGVVLLDLSLTEDGPQSGLSLLSQLIEYAPLTRVIVLTGHSSSEFGVQAIERGAHAFLPKPAISEQLKVLIEDAFNNFELRVELQKLRSQSHDDLLVGNSDAIKKIREEISFASSTSKPVLITGDTGTGKGLVAHLIHKQSDRSQKPFVRYQPSIGSAELTYAELFGARKGAYTGAFEDRKGLIAHAHKGTFFLDEVGELPSAVQISLLGVLQEKKFRPLGENRDELSDFRLISATNRSLDDAIKEGAFRLDLFHRINHHHIHIPSLLARAEDISLIVDHILTGMIASEGISKIEISHEAEASLRSHSWPGNIRELEATIQRAALKASFENRVVILKEDLGSHIVSANISSGKSFSERVEEFKVALIEKALAESHGNQVQASKALELDRSSMRRILARSPKAYSL